MIQPGEKMPSVALYETVAFGDACPLKPNAVSTGEALAGKRIVVFGVPGAFTTTCSSKHLPGFVASVDEFAKQGIDEVWCVSVNDGYVMAAWGREHDALQKVRMLGDGEGEFTKALGLEAHYSGMGLRMRRCSMLVDDGKLVRLNLEAPGEFGQTSAETMLAQLAG